ncbi:MAG: EAL domain-containing protein [Gammaproteobacteria bacterium]|nr:EAL domain-containing protein [Gammaproteobacteria bacterium]
MIILVLLILLLIVIIKMYNQKKRLVTIQSDLKQEIENRQRVERVLTDLARQSLDSSTKETFFNDCLINLANLFSAKYAFIGLFANQNKNRIKTFAVLAGNDFVDNFEYSLKNTPCQDVINLEVELISCNAAEKYPHDEMLIQMGIESYFGAPLIAPNGKMMGLVSVMDEKSLYPDENLAPILQIFANRIAIEMQRKQEEEELHAMANQLSFQASHDSLTGLINRKEFEQRMLQVHESAVKQQAQHGLCYMDLDQFKIVNDTCGHMAGDELLKQLSINLKHATRSSDTLARLGGDEFGVIFYDCPINTSESLAEKLLNEVKDFRFSWKDKVFEIGVSIGLVPIDEHSLNVYDLLKAADSACYVAKDLGRNRIHIYSEDDKDIADRKGDLDWVTKIKHAIVEDRFILYRQPISSIKDENSPKKHYEILVRMLDEKGQILPPGSFIQTAERYNLIYELDCLVISKCFSFISKYYSKEEFGQCNQLLYSINLSGQSLSNKKMATFIEDKLSEYNINPYIICFEITETSAISNFTQALNFINSMKKIGCCFALDDFGTGVCSYAYLKNIPVNYLKIDGNFIKELSNEEMNKAIIESMVNIAGILQISTIAEWVEDKNQLDILKQLGVDLIQGYYIGKPEPLPELKKH